MSYSCPAIILQTITASVAFLALSHNPQARAESEKSVSSISFSGNIITKEYVLQREILLRVGQNFSQENLDESIRNLRNLRIFEDVSAKVEELPNGIAITFIINEKLTLLPFARLKQGGGSTLFILGVGDLNTLGHNIEFLPMYENLNKKHHGGRVDARVPNIFDSSVTLDASIASQARSHIIYTEKGSVLSAYQERKTLVRSTGEHPISSNSTISLTLGLENSSEFGIGTIVGSRIQIGRINYVDWKSTGKTLSIAYDNFGVNQNKTQQFAHRISLELQAFAQIKQRTQLAFRVVATQYSPSQNPTHYCSVGGFSEVRGFLDERYRGRICWFTNAEIRNAIWSNSATVLQHAAFLDAGKATNRWQYSTFKKTNDPASLGTGFRLIFPHLARLILRIDAAFPVSGIDTNPGVSLGSVQFF